MILGLCGKKGAGKDTVFNVIQYVTSKSSEPTVITESYNYYYGSIVSNKKSEKMYPQLFSNWYNKKFASQCKEIVQIITGCSAQQLEDSHLKEQQCLLFPKFTYRELMQLVGTNFGRKLIDEDIWVKGAMKYYDSNHSDWVFTDTRFPNEIAAIKDNEGKIIKVVRPLSIGTKFKVCFSDEEFTVSRVEHNLKSSGEFFYYTEESNGEFYIQSVDVVMDEHESENSLGDFEDYDYVIYNDGTIDDLIIKVKKMLQHFKLI